MRVKRSEIGSVIIAMKFPSLPACLRHARNFALQSQAAEADAAHFKLADIAARTPANAAAVAFADLILQLLPHLRHLTGSGHMSPMLLAAARPTRAEVRDPLRRSARWL